MNGRPTLQELLEIQEHFGLPSPALVEKDWYVVKALAAIAAADMGRLRLVFGGGTALSRAHGLIKRMSEDIDLKIVGDPAPSQRELRALRTTLTEALLGAGFEFDPANPNHRNSAHHTSYTIYRLPYAPIAEGQGVLRPEIQVETSVWPVRRDPVNRPLRSFIAEANERDPEIAAVACTAIVESAAEKFVGLTRRAGAELAGLRQNRDPTLVRHVHDLHVIDTHYDRADMIALARAIMQDDAEAYGNHFPAYREDPVRETRLAVERIAADEAFATDFTNFQRDMVYGGGPDFATAVATLKALADALAPDAQRVDTIS